MKDDCVIEQLSPERLEDAYRIELRSFPRPYPRWYFQILYAMSASAYMAACNGVVVGFVLAVYHPAERVMHIADIAVDPAWRGRGIGSKLLKAVEADAKRLGALVVTLETWVSNLRARSFYEARGYRPLTIIPGYYEWGEAAIVYVKML